jgi:aryl-alcohol dehydrogenase-like predicted oxidoreductase
MSHPCVVTAPGSLPPRHYDDLEERYSATYLRQRLERSLRELRTECIDLLQLHTWTRAWNHNPTALATLRQFKQEGKVLAIGVSTPEHDQDSVVDLMRGGWVDSVQLIYNIFEQEPQSELLPTAMQHQVAVIVRVAMDEGALTGKLTPQTVFAEGDFRRRYFAGDRLQRTVDRVEAIRRAVGTREPDLATAALNCAEAGGGLHRHLGYPQHPPGRAESRRQRPGPDERCARAGPACAQLAPRLLVCREITAPNSRSATW